MSLDDDDDEEEEEEDGEEEEDMFSDTRTSADPVLEAVTREDATKSPSSFHPTLFRFFC